MFKGLRNPVLALLKTKVVLNIHTNFVSTVSSGADLWELKHFPQVIVVLHGSEASPQRSPYPMTQLTRKMH